MPSVLLGETVAKSNIVKIETDNDTILALRNTMPQAKKIFSFKIKDEGGDNLSTKIEKVRFERGDYFTQKYLYYLLGGLVVKYKGEVLAEVSKLSYSNARTSLNITLSKPIVVPDGQEAIVEVYGWVSTHKYLNDKETIQLKIAQKHGFQVADDSSLLEKVLPHEVESPIFTVEVKATELRFTKVPSEVLLSNYFTVQVSAVDMLGRTDLDYKEEIILSKEAGLGMLSSTETLTHKAISGVAEWTKLSYDSAENFTLTASSRDFESVESSTILASGNDARLVERTQENMVQYVSSLSVTEDMAQKVFVFAIEDEGKKDNNKTILSKISFKNANLNKNRWGKYIAGAVLFKDNEIVAKTTDISDDEIRFAENITIDNGVVSEIILGVYLKCNNLIDNSLLQFCICSEDFDWSVAEGSSKIESPNADMLSSQLKIEVVGTQLDFLECPAVLSLDTKTYNVRVGARDARGNIDTDVDAEIRLQGNGVDLRGEMKKGIAYFENIEINNKEDFVIQMSSGSGLKGNKSIVISEKNMLLSSNFEDGNLKKWRNTEAWKASSINPISGKYSLKHNLVKVSGTSRIVYDLGTVDMEGSTMIWRLQMKNGEWNPSSSNSFFWVLLSDSSDLLSENSFVLGVNLAESDDMLTLWKVENGKPIVLIKSFLKWDESTLAGLLVSRSSTGVWQLYYDSNGGFDNLYKSGEIVEKTMLDGKVYSGAIFRHKTASRAGRFWIDDIDFYQFKTEPVVSNLEVDTEKSIILNFNQKMDDESISSFKKYQLDKHVVDSVKLISENSVKLFVKALKVGRHSLKVVQLRSKGGKVMQDTVLLFDYYKVAQKGDVLLNELMVDCTPSVALPEYEYVELFNKTDDSIILSDWKLKIGDKEVLLPVDTLGAKKYLLLCDTSAKVSFQKYGKVLGIKKLPTMLNSGATIVLENDENIEIDRLSYTSSWYRDDDKKQGGWSLERIETERPTDSSINWTASKDARGGTPAEQNSVFQLIVDDVAPNVLSVVAVSKEQLQIVFDEAVDTTVIKVNNLKVTPSIGFPDSMKLSKNTLSLFFKNMLREGVPYKIELRKIVDLYGNSFEYKNLDFILPEQPLQNDIVINEVLFNPMPSNVDYVELYNRTKKTFDLSSLFIATRDTYNKLKTITPISKEIKLFSPNTFIVITKDISLIKEQYDVKNPNFMVEVKSLPTFPDKEGIIVILDKEYNVIDEFSYHEDMHFGLLATREGVSLERINYDIATQNKTNWHSAATVVGYGTPTEENSMYKNIEKTRAEWKVVPKVFSPNNDGLNDLLELHYNLDKGGWVANIRIYNSIGHLVKILARNEILETDGVIYWDGLNDDGGRLSTGRYIVLIEIFDEIGEQKQYKKTCVLYGIR